MRTSTLTLLCVSALCALPTLAATQTFKDVPVIDAKCATKVAANPDEHTRACAMQCSAAGFVIITPDKKTLKLDASGNATLLEELKVSQKKDHLRADVTGEVEGDMLKVQSIKLL
jgi:hypothetical protein